MSSSLLEPTLRLGGARSMTQIVATSVLAALAGQRYIWRTMTLAGHGPSVHEKGLMPNSKNTDYVTEADFAVQEIVQELLFHPAVAAECFSPPPTTPTKSSLGVPAMPQVAFVGEEDLAAAREMRRANGGSSLTAPPPSSLASSAPPVSTLGLDAMSKQQHEALARSDPALGDLARFPWYRDVVAVRASPSYLKFVSLWNAATETTDAVLLGGYNGALRETLLSPLTAASHVYEAPAGGGAPSRGNSSCGDTPSAAPASSSDPPTVQIYVDPIDGTNALVDGVVDVPMTLIGIALDGVPVAGVVNRVYITPNDGYSGEGLVMEQLKRRAAGAHGEPVTTHTVETLFDDPRLPCNNTSVTDITAKPAPISSADLLPPSLSVCIRHGPCWLWGVPRSHTNPIFERPHAAAAGKVVQPTKNVLRAVASDGISVPCEPVRVTRLRGAGYKLMRVVEGALTRGCDAPDAADFFLAQGGVRGWDACAPHAFLEWGGGALAVLRPAGRSDDGTLDVVPVRYNRYSGGPKFSGFDVKLKPAILAAASQDTMRECLARLRKAHSKI
jgi:3'-phosphoadenosine 5'-phosphosulfate (PAPS) 3'-phosphatase